MWEQTLPVFRSVVFPFFTQRHYFFIGGSDSQLIIGDAETGRILETFAVAEEPRGFLNPNSPYCLPYLVGNRIVLEGGSTMDRRREPELGTCGPYFLNPPPTLYVLDLDLPADEYVPMPGAPTPGAATGGATPGGDHR